MDIRRFLGPSLVLICLFTFTNLGRADSPREAKTGLTAEQRQRNLESFEFVWKTIRDKHFDPTLGGLDWQAVHEEYRPQVEKADSMARVRELLKAMIGRLGQSHFNIIPGSVYQQMKGQAQGQGQNPGKAEDTPKAKGQAVPGFDVRVVDGQVLVVRVEEGLSAAKLGVRPGWQVLKIDDEELAPALAKVGKTFKNPGRREFELAVTVLGRLRGQEGDKSKILFRDGADKEVPLDIPLTRPQGTPAQLGHLPTIYVYYEARKLDGNISYFALTTFLDPVRVMKAFGDAVKDSRQADGFILDLRGNPGGLGAMALGLGGWFVSKPNLKLGTMSTRAGQLNFVLNPRPEPFEGPLAILVDGLSASTSEILAGGLQDLKRARVFGTPTAGAALPSNVERLANGDGFQYAFANYVSAGGQALEGQGVRPDVVVAPERRALLAGHDPVLDAAVAWIRTHKKAPAEGSK